MSYITQEYKLVKVNPDNFEIEKTLFRGSWSEITRDMRHLIKSGKFTQNDLSILDKDNNHIGFVIR